MEHLWEIAVSVIGFLGGLVIKHHDEALKAMQTSIEATAREVAEHKLYASNIYAKATDVKEIVSTQMQALQRIEDKLDAMLLAGVKGKNS